MSTPKVLILTGDAGESLEVMYPYQRLKEEGYDVQIAALSKKKLHFVVHDFEPGYDTYTEKPGYSWDADLAFKDVSPADYVAVVIPGGRAPEYLRYDADLIRLPRWVGTANYSALFGDGTFLRSLEVTATFGLSVTGLETLLGLALGFLMHLRSRFSRLLQAVVFAPVVLPLTVTAIAWGYLVNPGSGAINRLLERAGVPTLGWLQDPGLALPTLVLITVWKGVGLPAVLYLAGLKQIPGELLEAAEVDGATPSQTTRRVTTPKDCLS